MNDFERKAIAKDIIYGKTSMDVLRKEVEDYWKNYYPIIEKREGTLKEEIKQTIIISNNIYNLLPLTRKK
ncbi:MAG: hypothetical protein MUF15_15480 [Acidobacteria bacterium]|nr:hypothetical protein [Acidobacteriota bacterium]